MNTKRVLVTGATGFVGHALVPQLQSAGWEVRASGRDPSRAPQGCEFIRADLQAGPDWDALVHHVHAVVHLAARVHVMHDKAADPLSEFRAANVSPTRLLAEAAARQGVQHFVYLSSIKVNGERTTAGAFSESDSPCPADAYGISKLEAERELQEVCARSALGLTLLRPPLIYGAAARGNFERLAKWVRRGMPVPLGAVDNRRSLLFVGNLCSALVRTLEHPPAGSARLYLLSDGQDLSTAALARALAHALGVRPWIVNCPLGVLRMAAKLAGRETDLQRLEGSLRVDSSRIRHELQWTPPFTVADGLRRTLAADTTGPADADGRIPPA